MTEAELQHAVEDLADKLGIWWWHERDSRRSRSGWVDLVLLGWHGALFAELKAPGGTRSARQLIVAELLIAAGLSYRVWQPRDWWEGTIEAELKAIA